MFNTLTHYTHQEPEKVPEKKALKDAPKTTKEVEKTKQAEVNFASLQNLLRSLCCMVQSLYFHVV